MKITIISILIIALVLMTGCTQTVLPSIVYTNLSSINNTLTYTGDLNVTGSMIGLDASFNNLDITTGYTGNCVNTTYSGGIAISCND